MGLTLRRTGPWVMQLAVVAASAVAVSFLGIYVLLAAAAALFTLHLGVKFAEHPSTMSRHVAEAHTSRHSLRRLAVVSVGVYVLGSLVWRVRSAEELAANPVDSAAALRIAGIAASVALLGYAFLQESQYRAQGAPIPRPPGNGVGILYAAYVAVVVLGAYVAVAPSMVLFRFIDLTVVLLLSVGIARWSTLEEAIRFVRGALIALAIAVGIGAILFPAVAIREGGIGLLPFQIQGVLPSIASNGVGAIGVMLFAIGMGRIVGRDRVALSLGLFLVLAAQYRTGYVAVLVIAFLAAWMRGTTGHRIAMAVMLPIVAAGTQTDFAQTLWNRGDASASTETLSGRTLYWSTAFEVVQRSQWIGTGLTSGTRFEVLSSLGLHDTSTIHSTWVEAYLGTGIIGVSLLASTFLLAVYRAWAVKRATLVPLLMLTGLLVRSLTGSTFELASYQAIFFLVIAMSARRCCAGEARNAPRAVGEAGR